MERERDELGVNVGDTVSFWVHASDENYTGKVQEILTLNGSLSMLILCDGDYRIVSLANVYGLSVIRQQQSDEGDEPRESHDERVGQAASHAGHQSNEDVIIVEEEEDQSPMLRRAISVIKSILPPYPKQIIMEGNEEEEEEEEVTCPICLDSIDMNQNAMSTECGHKFHFTCIMKNMAANSAAQNACPLCREPVIQGFSVTNDEESENRIFQRLSQETHELMYQLEQRRMICNMLQSELIRTEQMQRRVLDARHVLHQTAFQTITQHAQDAHLSETITNLIASAANNNIRENYEELYEFYHDEIRNMCFNLGMRILCGHREELVQSSDNPVQPQQHPIIID